MRLEKCSLRIARPGELEKLVAIDDEASELYAKAGLKLEFDKDHPFIVDEKLRWAGAIKKGLAHVAVNGHDEPIGFATLGHVDEDPYLDQISVLVSCMRRGVGTALLDRAVSWCDGRPLWLTTYAHLPWNRPYYEKYGFVTIKDSECGDELRAILQKQRAALPDPDQRIAMVRRQHRP